MSVQGFSFGPHFFALSYEIGKFYSWYIRIQIICPLFCAPCNLCSLPPVSWETLNTALFYFTTPANRNLTPM